MLRRWLVGVAAGTGVMDGCCVVRVEPTAEVAQQLPQGLQLATPSQSVTHPVVWLFTRQRNVRPGFMPFGGINYHEFVELIPYVEFKEDSGPAGGPFGYMPSLLLDQFAPVLIGVSLYGFNKRLAEISSHAGAFEIRSERDEMRVSIEYEGLPGSINDFPNLKDVRDFVEQPLISRARNRAWVFSYLDLCFDAASFQAVHAKAKFKGKDFDFPSILDRKFGAFQFQTKWSLSIPFSGDSTAQDIVPPPIYKVSFQFGGKRRSGG
jgi:acetoacetate decarboxylase